MVEGGIDVAAQLALHVGRLADQLEADRRRRRDLGAAISWVEAPAYQFYANSAFVGPAAWGPNTGFSWAIQRITLAGFGATTDAVTIYKGTSPAHATPQNALNTLSPAVTNGVVTWHPGGKGLLLRGDESLVLGGTFTGTTGIMNVDVIQIEDPCLPDYLV